MHLHWSVGWWVWPNGAHVDISVMFQRWLFQIALVRCVFCRVGGACCYGNCICSSHWWCAPNVTIVSCLLVLLKGKSSTHLLNLSVRQAMLTIVTATAIISTVTTATLPPTIALTLSAESALLVWGDSPKVGVVTCPSVVPSLASVFTCTTKYQRKD